MVVRRIARTLRRAQRPIVLAVQRSILRATLFALYYVGFGIARAVTALFGRRLYRGRSGGGSDPSSWWREAEGYELDETSLPRQS